MKRAPQALTLAKARNFGMEIRPAHRGLGIVALLLASGVGCFRATGIQRPSLVGVEIPAIGGDRPAGVKAEAAPGDYYLGNDSVELAVDGTPFGAGQAVAGAASGGSIIDLSFIGLDTSFRRVSMPGDMLDRLTPVLNQDPALPMVFSSFAPVTGIGESSIQMQGSVLDLQHKLAGATWDPQGRVQGLNVTHKVSLGTTDRFFVLETTLTNTSSATISVQSLGDHLYQVGGGLRTVVPADGDANGGALAPGAWGVQLPGSDFSNPINTSVRARVVGFIGVEPAGETVDSHSSYGILPLSSDHVLVASDPQNTLSEDRPKFSQNIVVGSLPVAGLAPGQTLSYTRKLYIIGGSSTDLTLPSQSTGLFNEIFADPSNVPAPDFGAFLYSMAGTASPGGLLQTEVRFEKNLGSDSSPQWQVNRVEWKEFPDSPSTTPSIVTTSLPTGTYRVTIRNRNQSYSETLFTNSADTTRPDIPTPLSIVKATVFSASEVLLPERNEVISAFAPSWANIFTATKVYLHLFTARGKDYPSGNFQPLRFTFAGVPPTPDLDAQRSRTLGGIYDSLSKAKQSPHANAGAYQVRAGNQAFGASFLPLVSQLPISFPAGNYMTFSTRGPLSYLDSLGVTAGTNQNVTTHSLIIAPAAMPTGWTAFDIPGPSQATGGGMYDAEKLSSALAEQVSVVGLLENDRFVDAPQIYNDFVQEFNLPNVDATFRTVIGTDPLTFGVRATALDSDGIASALFTPAPRPERNRGAKPSSHWTLADFIAQAEGSYVVIQRPRGPKGLFTLRGFNPTVPLGAGVNAWWNATGPVSQGVTESGFDALELIRAQGFDGSNPDPWFSEFKTVRQDWFALLNQQMPTSFTKGLGLSSGIYSLDTPVGLSRTYLKLGSAIPTEADLSAVQGALKSGAAVASTGPLLDVSINGTGPGGLVAGASVNLSINLYAPVWVPVDEVRVVVNGQVVQTLDPSTFSSGADFRQRTFTVPITFPTNKDAWVVVEAGVRLNQTGPYQPGSPWAKVQKGMYPIAITNPIFVDVNGGGYVPPGL